MKILHFSDSHAGSPAETWKAYLDKRWVGIFNYHFRRRFQHDQNILKKAVEYIIKSDADCVICTGDLTSNGQPSEFKKALEVLEALTKAKKTFFVPGNHDFYVHDNLCNQAMEETFSILNGGDLRLSDLPAFIDLGECYLILVNESRPTNLISSCGYLKREDSHKIIQFLQRKSKAVIIAGHYPLIEKHPWLRIRHRLWGERDVKNMLMNGVIDISLCGHVHKPYEISTGERGRGEYCSGSVTKTASISEIIYDKNHDTFKINRIKIVN